MAANPLQSNHPAGRSQPSVMRLPKDCQYAGQIAFSLVSDKAWLLNAPAQIVLSEPDLRSMQVVGEDGVEHLDVAWCTIAGRACTPVLVVGEPAAELGRAVYVGRDRMPAVESWVLERIA